MSEYVLNMFCETLSQLVQASLLELNFDSKLRNTHFETLLKY